MIIAEAGAGTSSMLFDMTRLSNQPNPFEAITLECTIIAFVILVCGLIMTVFHNRNEPSGHMNAVFLVGTLALCIASIPWFHTLASELLYWPARKLIQANGGINGVGDQLRAMVADAAAKNKGELSLLDLSLATAVVWIFTILMNIVAALGSIILIPFYYIQHGLDALAWTLMPLGIAFLSVPGQKHKGSMFISASLSLLAWPLGFAAVNAIAGMAMREMIENPPPAEYGTLGYAIGPFIVGGILILGSINVPLVCYFLFTSGASHAGASALGQGGSQAMHMGSSTMLRK